MVKISPLWSPWDQEREGKVRTYYKTMQPYFNFMRLFGRFSYSSYEGRFDIKWNSFWSVYSLLLYAVSWYCGVHSFWGIYLKLSNSEEKVEDFLLALCGMFYLVHSLLTPIFALFEWPKAVQYMNRWTEFEEDYFAFIGEPIKVPSSKMVLLSTWLSPFVITGLAYPVILTITIYTKWYNILNYGANLSCYYAYLLLWIFNSISVTQAASRLKYHMLKMLSNDRDWDRAAKLAKYRRLWVKLLNLFSDSGSIFGFHYLTIIVVALYGFISCFYIILISIMSQKYNFLIFLQTMLVAVVTIYIVIESSHHVANVLHFEFLDDILLMDTSRFDSRSTQEMELFLATVESSSPFVKFWGLVSVSRILWVSVMSSTITYMIILIQIGMTRIHSQTFPNQTYLHNGL